MITVLGRATSSNVQTAMWALAEVGCEVTRVDVGGAFGGLNTPEYRAMNPNGRIPVMKDGDLVLWESAAILRYLGARYGSEAFWPADPAVRARLDMWAEWIKTTFAQAFNYGVFWQMVRTPSAERDMAQIARNIEAVKPLALMLDARLGEDPYLGGSELCFADVMVGHQLYRYYALDFDKAATPRLDAYYTRLTERPVYAEHVMVSFESLRVD
ncbi:MAG: glutathione S-transferase family protein [Pseudomonadota bacterium]